MNRTIYSAFLVEPQRNENEPDNPETRFEACNPRDAEVWAVLGRRGEDWEVLEDFETVDEAQAFLAGCRSTTAILWQDDAAVFRAAELLGRLIRNAAVSREWQDRIVAATIAGSQWIHDSTRWRTS